MSVILVVVLMVALQLRLMFVFEEIIAWVPFPLAPLYVETVVWRVTCGLASLLDVPEDRFAIRPLLTPFGSTAESSTELKTKETPPF